MPFHTVDGEKAWQTVKGSKHLRWPKAHFDEQIYPVRFDAKFSLGSTDRVFCIGSCFARNVEEHLAYQGLQVLSQRIVSPASEFNARPAGLVNKFTTLSMLNELRWLTQPPEVGPMLFTEERPGQWFDLQLTTGTKPVSLERAVERRRYLIEDYFARLVQADVVIITLGLIESWKDEATELYLNAPPSEASVARAPGRYSLEVTGYDENLAALTEICNRLKLLNPAIRIVLTVSPIPLDISFTGADPVVANSLSKATLRAVAQVAAASENVDYFPSYEMITSAPRAEAFGSDCRHARDSSVRKVVSAFLHGYMGQKAAEPAVEFSELGYLAAHPDVDAAVRAGEFDSGFHHWTAFGKAESRRLLPEGGPTPLMVRAGQG